MSTLLLLLTVLTTPAYAYVLPEDILLQNSAGTEFIAPPSTRSAKDVKAQQRERSAQRRAAEQAAIFPAKEAEPTHSAAPAAAPAKTEFQMLLEVLSQQLNKQSAPMEEEDPLEKKTFEEIRKERLLQRLEAADAEALASETPEALHSGAPLADTGPGTILSMIVLLAIGAWTIRRARKSETVTL